MGGSAAVRALRLTGVAAVGAVSVVGAAGAVLAGCGGTAHPRPTPAPPLAACRPSQLALTGVANEGWTGGYVRAFVTTNRSRRACTVGGYPAMVMFDRAGKALPQPVRYAVDAKYRERPPRTVRLAPGDKATVIVTGGIADCRWVPGETRLVLSAAIASPTPADGLIPDLYGWTPGQTQTCGAPIRISPWQRGDVAGNLDVPEETAPPSP
jgi:hypothetical protein